MFNEVASFSGLASGIDWRTMIDQIVALEARPVTRLQQEVALSQSRTAAWSDFKSRVQTLNDAAAGLATGDPLRVFKATIQGLAAGVSSPLASVSAASTAAPGSHSVRVLATARNEKLGSLTFATRTEALGVAGELRVNGSRIEVNAGDSLDAIAQRFNAVSGGTSGTGVVASVLATGPDQYRLILTSNRSGAAGIDLVDGAAGVLQGLGLTDASTTIKHATSNGATSDSFADAITAVSSVLGFVVSPAGTVMIGGEAVAIDLATDSLATIANKINAAAIAVGKGFRAFVVDDTSGDTTTKQLDIRGTTSFADAGHVLEALGVLEAGRGTVGQVVHGAVLTDGDALTPAGTSTALSSLWAGGAAASAQVGDTLTITGTRADGSALSFDYTIGAGDTVQTLLDRMNSAVDGYQAGSATATATIDATGRITVTDDAGGQSRLALSIVAHNESGGTLDFGAFAATTVGIARQITAGADAEVEVDGTYFRRATNSISDTVPGLTFNLATADPDTTLTVDVSRDVDAATAAVKSMVDAYNGLTDFVAAQLAPPPEGGVAGPLYSNGVLRSMRSALRLAFQSTVATDVANGILRVGDLGIEAQRDGSFKLDEARLRGILATDGDAVMRLFGLHGASTSSSLSYIAAGSKAKSGTYAIDITQAATAAAVTGVGFGGAYVDDGVADTLTIVEHGANKAYAVQLANGMTTDDIVDAINAELATARAHSVTGSAVYADAAATPASDATTFSALHDAGGTPLGVAAGDELTISGTRADGSTFLTTLTITDPATQTLADLRAAVAAELGSEVDVSFVNGALTATATETGASLLTLAVSSDNLGGGTLSFGAFTVQTEGRDVAAIVASNVGGQLRLAHDEYGVAGGFDLSFTAGGVDGTAALGLLAGSFAGLDVAGTIGGLAATGSGRILTGAAGFPVDGLALSYDGLATGAVGDLSFSRGIGSILELAAKPLLSTGAGSIEGINESIASSMERMNARIVTLESRIEVRRDQLIRRFTALEQVMARANSQAQWLQAQLAQLQPRQQ